MIEVKEMLQRNRDIYVPDFKAPPYLIERLPQAKETRGATVLVTCCDPSLHPYKFLALEGAPGPPVTMIRVPGGRAIDAVKALAVMQNLGNMGTILLIHHTGTLIAFLLDSNVTVLIRFC
jgi:carbonic anhydrase